jgi:hypothetical protein
MVEIEGLSPSLLLRTRGLSLHIAALQLMLSAFGFALEPRDSLGVLIVPAKTEVLSGEPHRDER